MPFRSLLVVVALTTTLSAHGQAARPAGEVKGRATQHTQESLSNAIANAQTAVPSALNGGHLFVGKFKELPGLNGAKVPLVVFMHGSSGPGLPAIGEWQRWLAGRGIASLAPDSFALPDRLTYKSPVDVAIYEQIHALRAAELAAALETVKKLPWVDQDRLILAGTSEGGVSVARFKGSDFAARMIFSWSCEPNYFVTEPLNVFEPQKPVLNVISSTDPFFSPSNGWLGNPQASGHCGAALKDVSRAAVVLVPGAPHTLLNLPAARFATVGFLEEVLK